MGRDSRQEALKNIEIAPSDFVIDVGGGHRPFWRADLVIEKYPFDQTLHRNQPMQFPRVPVIKADASAIPVPDCGCDVIFASHIIEHLPDPARFIEEVKRCSKWVYLEFKRELMFAWSVHEWFVEAAGRRLNFYRNDLPQLFGSLFHEEYDAAFGAWCEARHHRLNTSIYCRSDELEYEFPTETVTEMLLRTSKRGAAKINSSEVISRPAYSLVEVLAIAAQSFLPNSVYDRLSRKGKAESTPAQLSDSVLARLMCLDCKSSTLRRFDHILTCDCGAKYTQDRGVFDFDLQKEPQRSAFGFTSVPDARSSPTAVHPIADVSA